MFVDNDAKALALGEGVVRRRGRGETTSSAMVVATGRRRRHRPRRPAARRAASATPATSGTSSSSPTAGRARAAAAAASRPRRRAPAIAAETGRPPQRRARGDHRAHGRCWSAGRSRRWRRCSTCGSRSSPARWRSGSASRSSPPRRPRSRRAPGSRSPRTCRSAAAALGGPPAARRCSGGRPQGHPGPGLTRLLAYAATFTQRGIESVPTRPAPQQGNACPASATKRSGDRLLLAAGSARLSRGVSVPGASARTHRAVRPDVGQVVGQHAQIRDGASRGREVTMTHVS